MRNISHQLATAHIGWIAQICPAPARNFWQYVPAARVCTRVLPMCADVQIMFRGVSSISAESPMTGATLA
jgi:hypothetical protein